MTQALLINESPLQILPSLAQSIGLNEAVILQQIHYWLNPKHNKNVFAGRHWVFNSYEQWQKQFPFWCTKTIWRAITNLQNRGLLSTFVTHNFKKIKYYTINYEALDQLQEVSSPKPVENLTSYPVDINAETISQIAPLSVEGLDEEGEGEDLQEMMFVWNSIVQQQFVPYQEAYLTSKRLIKFGVLQDTFLNGMNWKDYCNKIAQTNFLMGGSPSGFKVTIDWALNVDNAAKVLEGAIYDKPVKEGVVENPRDICDWNKLIVEIKEHLPPSAYTTEWLRVCQSLFETLGGTVVKAWFLKVGLITLNQHKATLQVDSEFKKTYLDNHFRNELETALHSVYPSLTQIEFQVANPQGSVLYPTYH